MLSKKSIFFFSFDLLDDVFAYDRRETRPIDVNGRKKKLIIIISKLDRCGPCNYPSYIRRINQA